MVTEYIAITFELLALIVPTLKNALILFNNAKSLLESPILKIKVSDHPVLNLLFFLTETIKQPLSISETCKKFGVSRS